MAMTLITTNTSSDADFSDFTSGIDSTYKLYIFKFYDINPATVDGVIWQFQASTDAGSSWGVNITSTFFRAGHTEADATSLAYETGYDLAQSTNPQPLAYPIGSGSDESAAGELYLFNPSNTTYVKHFYGRATCYDNDDAIKDNFAAGYINTTSAVDGIRFYVHSQNHDSVVKMYGVG